MTKLHEPTAGHGGGHGGSKGASRGPPKLRLYTPVLQRLWADGRVEEARRVWEEMMARGAMPNEDHVVSMVRPVPVGLGLVSMDGHTRRLG